MSARTAEIDLIVTDPMKKRMNQLIVSRVIVQGQHVPFQEYLFTTKKDQSQKAKLIVLVVRAILAAPAIINLSKQGNKQPSYNFTAC